jgi:hypothetical protein
MTCKGGQNPTFSSQMHWFLVSMQNKDHGLIQALDTWHRHWRTLGPLSYNLNLFVKKLEKKKIKFLLDLE